MLLFAYTTPHSSSSVFNSLASYRYLQSRSLYFTSCKCIPRYSARDCHAKDDLWDKNGSLTGAGKSYIGVELGKEVVPALSLLSQATVAFVVTGIRKMRDSASRHLWHISADGCRQHDRTGTWQFMSIKLLTDPASRHELQDDLESFFWAVVYHGFCYLELNASVPQTYLQDRMKAIFDSYRPLIDGSPGGVGGIAFL
ncbi:hypothetical protein BD779DRAFT_1674409 [Infundibulicybe gibba]|nr:hypothetical protein BD779DRAFT_1674409 [Infundibulicybe gibba]